MSELDLAEEAYERAEGAYLAGIRSGVDRAEMTERASTLARAAGGWNTVAYRAFHAAAHLERDRLELLTERTEVLSELWADVLNAYRTDVPELNAVECRFNV